MPRRSSSLKDHKQDRKVLKPPLLQFDNMVAFDWRINQPDMLWLAAMLVEYPGDWRVVDALEALDPFVGGGTHIVDGRLTAFDLVPPRKRAAAQRAFRDADARVLPDGLGHALALLDDCPGSWIFEDWAYEHDHDPVAGANYLRLLLTELIDSRGEFAVHARMLSMGRYLRHGRIHFGAGLESVELLKRYPSGCDEDERIQARQMAKMTYDMVLQTDDELKARSAAWGQSFWKQSARLARSGNPAMRVVP